VAALLAACGGGSSSDANEPSGTYRVKVTEAEFPTEQNLGQTSVMQLGVRNTGKKTVPALTVTVTIAGKAGRSSSLPFGVREAQTNLAQSDRPVWVLSEGYPRLLGSSQPGGAGTSNRKTFDLGPLKPGDTTTAVWKLSAVRPGDFTVLYRIDAGLSGTAKAETAGGIAPGGSFVTDITQELPETEVNDAGEVVEIQQKKRSEKSPAGE
jgi:hypothetical protein